MPRLLHFHGTADSTRLSVEMGWLLGVSPSKVRQLIDQLATTPDSIPHEKVLPALAHANLMAAAFGSIDTNSSSKDLAKFIIQFASLVESIEIDSVRQHINEDRIVSGFPEVQSLDLIENELSERKRSYKKSIIHVLNKLDPSILIRTMTQVAEDATSNGDHQAPHLIDDLIDNYELECQTFLQSESGNINKLIESIRAAAPSGSNIVDPMIDKLEKVTRNWDGVAQPIQLCAKARGTKHQLSNEVAYSIRRLSLDLFKKHDLLQQSIRITNLISEVFAEVVEVAELSSSDSEALTGIETERKDTAKLVKEIGANKVYRVRIGARSINYTKLCTCCLSDKNLKDEKISHEWEERGIVTRTKYTRSFEFPICQECLSHRKEYYWKKWLVAIISVAISSAIGFFMIKSQEAEWINMAGISAVLTVIAVFLVARKVKLSILPEHHACRADSVEMSDATSQLAMVFHFHNPLYAKAFAAANNEVVTIIDETKPPRGEKLLEGKGKISLCVWSSILGIIIMSFLRN